MTKPHEIAAWRFEQIAPLIDPSLDAARRREALRERTTRPVPRPGNGTAKAIAKSTLYRWLAAYREQGYAGLLPQTRADRGGARRAGTRAWIGYAMGLLYESPERSLTQIEIYLHVEFPDYALSRSTLNRHLRAHPAFSGIEKLRRGDKKKRLRDLYEADYPHESWQLDGKGPFTVRLRDGKRIRVHVLSILDDHSRFILAVHLAGAEDTKAAIAVLEKAALKWGLADRFQFDRGSAFDSHAFRNGLAQLGVHRNAVAARSPESQGKIEAYHRSLGRWFVKELKSQEVVDLEHLQQLLDATIALVYQRHHHREIGTTPEKRLAGRISERRVSASDLARAFFVEERKKSDPKTGQVRLSAGSFRVPFRYAGQRCRFLVHPVHQDRAFLIARDGHEIEIEPFRKKPLSTLKPHVEKRGTGQLQKLLDLWQGRERPNAQPGFGLPEVFAELQKLVAREVPDSEREAHSVLAFYRKHGPLPREDFRKACARAQRSLGSDRPLSAYLEHLERQILHPGPASTPDTEERS